MFLRQNKGSISLLSAFFFGVLFFTSGLAIDYTNALRVKVDLQLIADAATLSVTKVSLNGTDRETRFRQSVDAQLATEGIDPSLVASTLVVDEKINSVTVTGTLQMLSDDFMLGGLGLNLGQLIVSATGYHEVKRLEIALVVDISSSMRNGKLASLREATTAFLDHLMFYEDGTRNYHVAVSLIPYGGSVLLPAELQSKVSLNSSTQPHFDRQYWTGCLVYKPSDLNDGLLSLTAATGSYEPLPHYWVFRRKQWWCPKAGNEIVPLTTDYAELMGTVDSLDLSDGTGSHLAVMWGWKMLSPRWRGALAQMESGLPTDHGIEDVAKVLILMTDGGTSYQVMPSAAQLAKVPDTGLSGHYKVNPEKASPDQFQTTQPEAVTHFNAMCEQVKATGIVIYGVGYDIASTGDAMQSIRECVTSDRHYFNPDRDGLSQAFQAIATQLNPPRLIK